MMFRDSSFWALWILTIASALLVLMIAVLYSYDTMTWIEAGVGFAILCAVAVFFWIYLRHSTQYKFPQALPKATSVGIILGILWLIEIGINNLVHPPLPLRDIIDNLFWAAIAISIFVLAIISAYQARSLMAGIRAGAWSGLVSGLIACFSALFLIAFGMQFITQDPLNIAEWVEREATSQAPSMAAYFAFETFAGAFLHLLVLGLLMGGLLGIAGGLIGKITRVLLEMVHASA